MECYSKIQSFKSQNILGKRSKLFEFLNNISSDRVTYILKTILVASIIDWKWNDYIMHFSSQI